MPMPPPNASTQGSRGKRTRAEVAQIVRALSAEGPQTRDGLMTLVGATYWDVGRFDRALLLAVADGRAVRTPDGSVAAV